MFRVVKESDVEEMKFGNFKVKELLMSDKPSLAIAKVQLSGKGRKVKDIESDNYYYISEGEGAFVVDGREHKVKKGDLVCIPKGVAYQDSGNMTMVAVSVPKFDMKNIVVLES